VKKPNPLKTKYAAFSNAKRAHINATVFKSYLRTYHIGISEWDITMTSILIKAGTK
jgi:hypothetical protein